MFTYRIDDGNGGIANATVSIMVTAAPKPPIQAVDDSATTTEGGKFIIIDVLANDSAPPGVALVITTPPSFGTAVVNLKSIPPSVFYTHDGSETASDSFVYQISDGKGGPAASATVTITITPVNDPPVAENDSATVTEGGSVLIDVLDNDSDADNSVLTLSITILQTPSNGMAIVDMQGVPFQVRYTHDGSQTTSDSFTYQIDDLSGGTDVGTVTISVTPPPPPMLTLVKAVTNDNGGSAQAGDWTLTAIEGGGDTLSGASGTAAVTNVVILSGTPYTLSESGGPSGYAASAWSCTGGQQSGATISAIAGESAVCTIINDDIAPSLTLDKIVVNDDGGTMPESAWTLQAQGQFTSLSGPGAPGNTDVQSDATFVAGTYLLAENGPGGYAPSGWTCVGGSQNEVVISLTVGESAICTITNDDIAPPGTITLRKDTVPDDPQFFLFFFDGSADPVIALDDDGDDGNALSSFTTFPIPAGSHTFSEEIVAATAAGFTLDSITCLDGGGADVSTSTDLASGTVVFDVAPGADVTCTFVNSLVVQETGTLTLVVDAVPNDPQDFLFFFDSVGPIALDDGSITQDDPTPLPNSFTFSVASGPHTLSEDLTATGGFILSAITCLDSGGTDVAGSTDLGSGTVVFDVAPGAHVTCTFRNVFNAPPAPFGLTLSDATVPQNTPVDYVAIFRDPDGAADLALVQLRVHRTCRVVYDVAANSVLLTGGGQVPGVPGGAPGTPGTIEHARCRLDLGASSVGQGGSLLVLSLRITIFETTEQNVDLWARDRAGSDSGWVTLGQLTTVPAQPPTPLSLTISDTTVPQNTPVDYVAVYRDANGADDLAMVQLRVHRTCRVVYDIAANSVLLTGGGQVPGVLGGAPGTPGTIEHARCRLDLGASSVSQSGTDLTLRLRLTIFETTEQNVDLWARDRAGSDSGWVTLGQLTTVPAQPPTPLSLTMSATTVPQNTPVDYLAIFRDPNGADDLAVVQLRVHRTCRVVYDIAANSVLLTGGGQVPGVLGGAPGTPGTIEHARCRLDLGASSVSQSGTDLTLRLRITIFEATEQNVDLWARDRAGSDSGWATLGRLTVQ